MGFRDVANQVLNYHVQGYKPMNTTMGLLSSALPSPYGDAAGLLADAAGYAENPKSLTPLNGLLSLAAMVPGIPSKSSAGSVFRAVGPDELRAIKESKQVKSALNMALPVEKHFGLTGFADSIDEAAMYAKANLQNSGEAFVLQLKKTPDMRRDYVALPKMAKRLDEITSEIGQLRKTISDGKVPQGMDTQFSDWLRASEDEAKSIADAIAESGVPLEKIRSAPGAASLPYLMTPNAVPAENIQKVFRYGADGELKPVKFGR